MDPEIIAARTYFHLDDYPNVNTVAADGRSSLAAQPPKRRYSVIAIDAYRPPYIPFQLATVEFFEIVRDHLAEDGVVAVNQTRSKDDYSLVNTFRPRPWHRSSRLSTWSVGSTEGWSLGNSLVVATMQPTTLDDFLANAAALDPSAQPLLSEMAVRGP